MKELTIEEKAKAYDKALEAAHCIYKNMKEGGNFSGMEDLEVIFPELKESEDEKIRKDLIEFLNKASGGVLNATIPCDTFSKWCTWLEKLGEQKPIEWSEEDEKMYKVIHDLAWESYRTNRRLDIPPFGTLFDWLKQRLKRKLK